MRRSFRSERAYFLNEQPSSSSPPCEWKNCSSRSRRKADRFFPGNPKSMKLARVDGGYGR
jgi:hypothetical protein